ncbi:hypothetical protein LRU_00183 [Ligilactobacillus ruminis SPM0211]|uniref:Uncharacterized protein n=1 Tax=Ligilactobacillus ruminis SPM0211 TaxID=1040964 RepID=F7QXN9_9LACO|nr:hypothetical protein LRU_00183 [Ligilactobacillus ruminis SPM0211]
MEGKNTMIKRSTCRNCYLNKGGIICQIKVCCRNHPAEETFK